MTTGFYAKNARKTFCRFVFVCLFVLDSPLNYPQSSYKLSQDSGRNEPNTSAVLTVCISVVDLYLCPMFVCFAESINNQGLIMKFRLTGL